jgi:secreted PhoX family phosphatase
LNRRQFIRFGSAFTASALLGNSLWSKALAVTPAPPGPPPAEGGPGPYGPLLTPDANGIQLPAGFRSRVIARSLQPVANTGYVWHVLPDGGAVFRASDGWIYVSNSEMFAAGFNAGASAIRFDRDGGILGAYSICEDTTFNCAGGATPWGTWLTCEEHDGGFVWECDPTGLRPAVQRAALGTFKHEAVAYDWLLGAAYLTEDQRDGRFYRFRPDRWRDVSSGQLEVASVDDTGHVTWLAVPEANPSGLLATATRHQVPASTAFDGGEGIVYHGRHVYLTTKGDNRVWDYHPQTQQISVLYEAATDPVKQLTGVDNATASRSGDLLIAEDGGNMELVLLTPDRVASPLLRIVGQDSSEITGPAFDPSGERLYFSSQRADNKGITYEVSGPFRRTSR